MHHSINKISEKNKIDELIKKCQICRIALSKDDKPYLIPISFGYDGKKIYFHTAMEGKKIDIIEFNNNVCFEFENNVQLNPNNRNPCKWSFSYETVIGEGIIEEIKETNNKINALNIIMQHYSDKLWQFQQKSLNSVRVWSIKIKNINYKISK